MEAAAKRDLHDAIWRSHGGFDLVLGPVIFALFGLWIDDRTGTTPWFTLGLLLFGATGAALKVYYDWKRNMDLAAARTAELRAETARLRAEAAATATSTPAQEVGP